MRALVCLLLASLLSACTSTTLVHDRLNDNWRGPSLDKLAVVVIATRPGVRAALENALVDDLRDKGAQAFAVHAVLMDVPESLAERKAALKALVAELGADGVLVLSLVGINTERHFVGAQMAPVEVVTGMPTATSPYWGYTGYYQRHYEYVYVPGYEEVTQDYRLDASLFAVGSEKPVWQGETSTVNPASLDEAIDGVAMRLTEALAKHGLLTRS